MRLFLPHDPFPNWHSRNKCSALTRMETQPAAKLLKACAFCNGRAHSQGDFDMLPNFIQNPLRESVLVS